MTISPEYSELLASYSSSKFTALWPGQTYVLGAYAQSHEATADLAIELPTGAGKSLVSLLVAEAWRRLGNRVAILTANKTLARQMLQESQELGMDAVLMEGRGEDIPSRTRRGYQRATHVGIMNYWVYFNQNPVIDPADLLIMDDAHLAEHCLHTLYSVEISRQRHASLFNSLAMEILASFPEYSVLADAISNSDASTMPPELLSFLDQSEIVFRIREIIDSSPLINSDLDLRFRWNRIRGKLNEINMYLGINSIWLRPYIYPLTRNEYYENAKQRIYSSATIGDPSDLARRLGTKPITKLPVPKEYSEVTSGRRLIAMNRTDDADIPQRLGLAIHAALGIHPKSVWLCASETEATRMQGIVSNWLKQNGITNQNTWILTSLGDEIDQFKAAESGHLFVAGRFDGMDFSQQQCRLVIMMTLPRAINLQEEFISAYLRDAGFMRRRLNQRIVQALGRCNRAPEDFAMYILGDRRFVTHFGRESNRSGLTRNIVAEVDLAQDMAETPELEFISNVQDFLQEDFVWYDDEIAVYRGDVPPIDGVKQEVDTSENEIEGWTALFADQDYNRAARHFSKCIEKLGDGAGREIAAFHQWTLAKAVYLQSLRGEPGAEERALITLEDAIGRGGHSSWFNRMRTSLNRVRSSIGLQDEVRQGEYAASLIMALDEELERLGTRGDRFDKWAMRVSERV